jgi:glyoxylase-like metal-dependent hydrolase (beta-lactamase superfamily II)
MKVEQIYTGCLAEAAYYESKGEAAIIDPCENSSIYQARRKIMKIKYIFETHFHADFVSGHVELAHKTVRRTGHTARTPTADLTATAQKMEKNLKIGDLTIRVLHTPGHTLESSTSTSG